MSITQEEVLKIATLARLELTSEELVKFTKQFGDILDYVAMLRELDTDMVEPTSQVTGLTNVVREDVVGAVLPEEKIFLNAPDHQNRLFKVKKVIE